MNEAENVPQVISSWSLNVRSWTETESASVVVLRYEDMLSKPLKEFRKIVKLWAMPRDDARLKRADCLYLVPADAGPGKATWVF